jgi:CheY-like chemotaxis protein
MKPKALVVEDDDRIIESIEDTLFSIGHDHDWATNQHDAQQKLRTGDYSYVLLDLQIPAKPNRGGADKEFGANLLSDIQLIKGRGQLPVIVMTAYSSDCLDLTTELFSNGASDFIAKPFSNKGRTLAKVIRKVLDECERRLPAPVQETPPIEERPFAGGEMVFYEDRVELCEVTVVTDARAGMMRKILNELKCRNSAGRFVAYSGPELVERLGCLGGQNAVAGCVRDFRKFVTETLRERLGVLAGPQDVIRSGGPGYRLNEWITIRATETISDERLDTDIIEVTASRDEYKRRLWILAELEKGRALRVPGMASELGCSTKTVKRVLDALRVEGLIEFVGPTKTGSYRLKQ